VLEQALARVDAQLTDVRNQLNVGLVAPSDVLSVEAQRSRQRMLLIDARAQRDVAAADLRRLTGMAPEAPFTIALDLTEPIAPPDLPQALLSEAQTRRPEREAYQRRFSAAGARRIAAAAGRRPVMAVAAGYDYARPNPRIFPREEGGVTPGTWAST
jgi:outer membrane protein TolC